jgi:L-seryl-tRNA(Ser) seleniumtransferase
LARSISNVDLPHPLLVEAAREAINAGDPDSARGRAEELAQGLLHSVINATGVLLHTNMGRAPYASSRRARYSNLELDPATGRRGDRRRHAAGLIARLIGAEAALVVNNGASAVFLVLSALAQGRRVVVSRGELVEIGGGFRIPDVLRASGAEIVEVGTTNRTRIEDYAAVIDEAALVLKVHQSNYRMLGFVASVDITELAALGTPVVFDIGSGLLDAAVPWLASPPPTWLTHEPAARQSLAAGASVVTFSGDKLLGGPQAGVVAGRADLIERCARHPLYRVLRPGAMVLGALQDVALSYLHRDGQSIPFWRMATSPVDELYRRAKAIGVGHVVETRAIAGGGSLPGLEIPSVGIALPGDCTEVLRRAPEPVIARVSNGSTIADLRTVDPSEDMALGCALETAARRGAADT